MLDSPIIDKLHRIFLILHFCVVGPWDSMFIFLLGSSHRFIIKKSTFYDRGFSTKDVVFEVWQFITQWMYDTKEVI